MKVAGIDYSINGPGITIFEGNEFVFKNTKNYYLTNMKKYDMDVSELNIYGELITGNFKSDFERWDFNGSWAYNIIKECDFVYMEGYSLGSKSSMAFQIAENASIIKYKMYKNNIPFKVIPPTTIKKFASGKGNASKEIMEEAFMNETNIDLKPLFKQTKKQWNPSGDIVDSYYICKMAYEGEIL